MWRGGGAWLGLHAAGRALWLRRAPVCDRLIELGRAYAPVLGGLLAPEAPRHHSERQRANAPKSCSLSHVRGSALGCARVSAAFCVRPELVLYSVFHRHRLFPLCIPRLLAQQKQNRRDKATRRGDDLVAPAQRVAAPRPLGQLGTIRTYIMILLRKVNGPRFLATAYSKTPSAGRA